MLDKAKWGVHEHHCCNKHGCKYGNPECPVELKLTSGLYACEYCSEEEIEFAHEAKHILQNKDTLAEHVLKLSKHTTDRRLVMALAAALTVLRAA